MAIQRYQRAGLQIADQPRIDPIGIREGARTQQMLSQAMDRVAGFAFERAAQEYRVEAKQAGARMVQEQGAQPTLLQLAEQGGPQDLIQREAFEVANRVAASEVETEGRIAMNQLLDEAKTSRMDFETFQSRVADIKDGFSSSLINLDPVSAAVVGNRLEGVGATTLSNFGQYVNKQSIKDAQGRALLGIAQRQNDIYALAGSDNELREDLVVEDVNALAEYMRDLQFSEAQISEMQINTLNQAKEEEILYDFQNLPTIQDKQAFLAELEENPPKEFGIEKTRALRNKLRADLNNNISLVNNTARDLKSEVKDMRKILTNGGNPSLEDLYKIGGQVAQLGDAGAEAQQDYKDLLMLREATLAFRQMNPGELQRTINEMRGGMPEFGGEGVDTLFETEVIETAEGLLRRMNTRLEQDPLSFGAEVGVIDFTPIDFTNPENLAPSIEKRIDDALKVSRTYTTEPRFLTDEESSALVESMRGMDRLQKARFLGVMNDQFGRHTPDVLAEMSDKAPDLAHVGGLVTMGNVETVNYALKGQDLIAQGSKAAEFTASNTDLLFRETIGTALGYQEEAYGAGRQVAEQIYTAKAFERGLAEFDEGLWQESIALAFGFNKRTGRGGVQEVRGKPVLLPPELNAEDLMTMLDELDAGKLNDVTGLEVDPKLVEEIRDTPFFSSNEYSLMATDMGVYRIVYGEPGTSSFSVVTDKDGNVVELDALQYLGIAR